MLDSVDDLASGEHGTPNDDQPNDMSEALQKINDLTKESISMSMNMAVGKDKRARQFQAALRGKAAESASNSTQNQNNSSGGGRAAPTQKAAADVLGGGTTSMSPGPNWRTVGIKF